MEYYRRGVVQVLVIFSCSQFLMHLVHKQIADLQVHVPSVLIVLAPTCSCMAEEHIHGEVCTCAGVQQEKNREDGD